MSKPLVILCLALLLPLAGQAQTIFPGESGAALRAHLKADYKPGSVLSINNARDTLFAVVSLEPGNVVTGVYSGFQIVLNPNADPNTDALGKGMNVEHTLPQSKGATEGTDAHSDLHNLFPTRSDVNSARSNHPFGEVADANTDRWYCDDDVLTSPPSPGIIDTCSELDLDALRFEPPEAQKGDVARAVFYMATMYDTQLDTGFFDSQKNTLRDWHDADPADADETDRSAVVAGYQDGKDNPYVLDATLVERAFFEATPPPPPPGELFISELRIDQPGSDVDEYLELVGPAGTALDGLTYLVLGDGTGGSGVIENVTTFFGASLPSDGVFVAAEATFTLATPDLVTTLDFENSDNVTHLLVSGFTGSLGDDLDPNDDGILDVTPWDEVLDAVGLVETTSGGDAVYGAVLGFTDVGPDGTFVPGHVFRDGTGWQIGAFDPAGGDDTPGVNQGPPPAPEITLLGPNGGEAWAAGSTVAITWDDNLAEDVRLILLKNGAFDRTIAAATASDGAFDYAVPPALEPGTDYAVRVRSVNDPAISDDSDAFFEVLPTITVHSPPPGAVWAAGTTHDLVWDDNLAGPVRILLFKGGVFHSVIETSTPSDGFAFFPLPTTLPPGTDYTIRIRDVADAAITDDSGVFEISAGETVTVTTPNGGEIWTIGQPHEITWTDNFAANVRLMLFQNGAFVRTINGSTASDGSYTWTPPASLTPGGGYALRVRKADNYLVRDDSDAPFTLAAPAEAPAATALDGNHPNPFNPATTLRYTLADATPVRLTVFDLLGRTVATLVDGPQPAGVHTARFDAAHLPSGVYLYRLDAGAITQTRTMLLMK